MNFNSRDAVVIDYARTAMGRSKNGCFRHVRADEMSVHVVNALLERNAALDRSTVDDVLWGCVMQRSEQGFNIARNIVLRSGLPNSVPGQTINRLCGSSMSALHAAVSNISSGMGDVYIVGGVEHMGHIDMMEDVNLNPALRFSVAKASASMGATAEYLAQIHGITREAMDAFAASSHRRAYEATISGKYAKEIIPILGHDEKGVPLLVSTDETIRPDTTVESLSALKPVFKPDGGMITAGSSSQVSDGASAMIVVSGEMATALGLSPIAKIVSTSIVGLEPSVMGYGPVPATTKALLKLKLAISDIDIIELNEAFSAQALSVLKDLGSGQDLHEKTNLWGGAIALGHPFGCSGTRITGTLLSVMKDQDAAIGLSTMCIGLGQGIATVVERIN